MAVAVLLGRVRAPGRMEVKGPRKLISISTVQWRPYRLNIYLIFSMNVLYLVYILD